MMTGRISSIILYALISTAALAGDGQGIRPENAGRADAENRGQIVADCNQRANERSETGQDRKDFVEWCLDNARPRDERSWDRDGACYSQANDRRLSGRERSDYLNACIDAPHREYLRNMGEVDPRSEAQNPKTYW